MSAVLLATFGNVKLSAGGAFVQRPVSPVGGAQGRAGAVAGHCAYAFFFSIERSKEKAEEAPPSSA